MPLQNRVDPLGEIVATPERGLMLGNRGGRIHRVDRSLARRRWASRAWICCRLSFKGRQRAIMAPNSYTELFFLDEATALAAGHRPCAECRRADFLHFARLWVGDDVGTQGRVQNRAMADDMDMALHQERLAVIGVDQAPRVRLGDLPDGSMYLTPGGPHLVVGSRTFAWSASGYRSGKKRDPDAEAALITPPSILRVLAAGYQPLIHPSAIR